MINNKNYISDSFTFDEVQFDNVLEKIEKLDKAKTSQQTDIPTKLLKQNSRYFADIFSKNINYCFENSDFPTELKLADVIPVYKKKSKVLRIIIGQSVSYLTSLKYMKGLYMSKCNLILRISYQNLNVVFENVIMPNTA